MQILQQVNEKFNLFTEKVKSLISIHKDSGDHDHRYIQSPTIRHIVEVTESNLPADPDPNTLYVVVEEN